MFRIYNPNPNNRRVGDCVIRSICKALNQSWEETYIDLCIQGYLMNDLPSSNQVWGTYLKGKGFKRDIVSDECPECYTLEDFCKEHPEGTYVIGTGTHAIAVVDGDYYDTWESGYETPLYFWERKENEK